MSGSLLVIGTPPGGNVSGPASATDGHIAVFDGATGKLIKDGGTISSGSVTSVIAQGGPFLANGTITSSGTINNSAASLTAHGIILAQGTSVVVATAALTNGQLLLGVTGADPAPQTMSGDATINAGGTITVTKIGGVTPATVANSGAVLNSGTVQVELNVTQTATAGGTVTISPGTGTRVSVITLPTAGGTVTVNYAGTYNRQTSRIDFKQGATASVVVLNSGTVNGFVFGTSGGPTSFTVTPTANAIDELGIEGITTAYARVTGLTQGFTA